jgi:hypothetical protein
MRNSFRNHYAVAFTLLLAACGGNTSVVNSWKDPTLAVHSYKKPLALFISNESNTRRAAEDQMARRIPGAVPAYTVIPDSILKDTPAAKAFVEAQGFDAAVIMRPVAMEKETNYVPGATYSVPAGYRSAWGYYGAGWGYAGDPGHYTQDKVLYVETNLYSLTEDKLVWSSRSKSYNPDDMAKLVDEIVNQNIEEMRKQGALPPG